MRTLEFKSKIQNNQILVPEELSSELSANQKGDVRVIVFIDESESEEDLVFRESAKSKFLNDYANSDSIYDK